jgi:BCD family chlorophyll transporter-like MFS transporter
MMSESQPQNLSVGRNLKIGFFHLGSGMADVIASGVWNRIMISDLGFSATPVGLLVALRYFLAPLGVWAGRISDQRAIGGYRRLFWIWLGRAMMMISMATLGLATAQFARGSDQTVLLWTVITVSMLLFSLGNALSGSTFLALIYDRTPEHQRGRAVGLVWTFLLLGYTVAGFLFGVLLPRDTDHTAGIETLQFSPDTLQTLFLVAAGLLGSLWFFSLLGEERRTRAEMRGTADAASSEPRSSLRADLKLAWSSRSTRFFFWYLSLSMIFAFSQDLILEPFAGDVFGMEARHTTRFAAYWGSMSILGTLLFLVLSRRFKWLTNTVMNYIGVGLLVATFALFAYSSFAVVRPLVTPGLILLGLGLGIWNVGTLGLMMDMSPFGRAGTFLGFWTLVVTMSRGIGVSGGGIVRDLMLRLTGDLSVSYGIVFAVGAVGLVIALWTLHHVKVGQYQETADQPAEAQSIFAGAMD